MQNIKEHGAIGDGQYHRIAEWVTPSRTLQNIVEQHPIISTFKDPTNNTKKASNEYILNYSIDYLIFLQMKAAGIKNIYFPEGKYYATEGWQSMTHDLDIFGAGKYKTTLLCGEGNRAGYEISGYRRVGWNTDGNGNSLGIDGLAPYVDNLEVGMGKVTLKDPNDINRFPIGSIVFLCAGSSVYFDQEYGEFNEVIAHDDTGIYFKENFTRPYTTEHSAYAAKLTANFTAPQFEQTEIAYFDRTASLKQGLAFS